MSKFSIFAMFFAIQIVVGGGQMAQSAPTELDCRIDPIVGTTECVLVQVGGATPGFSTGGGTGATAEEGAGQPDPCTYKSLASGTEFSVAVKQEADGSVWVQHSKICPWGVDFVWFRMDTDDPAQAATAPPIVTPAMLLPDLFASVERSLPRPIPRIGPADWDDKGYAFVQMPTFFWVDEGQGQWATVSGTASLPGLSVTVQAVPEELVVSTGDGGEVHCPGAPSPFPQGTDPMQFAGCQHTYRDSSAMAPNGQTFPVQVSIVWHASWTASNGQSGDLGTLTTSSDVRHLPVAEVQAVLTG